MAIRLTEIDNAASFHAEGQYQLCCANCASTGPWDTHHVVQRQRLRRGGAPQCSPDDALRVCSACHERHTNHVELLPLRCLRDENIAFAERWLGAGPAYEYFTRYYSGADPRVDQLLEVIDGD